MDTRNPDQRLNSAAPLTESLSDALTLMNKSGRFTPERQAQLDRVAATQAAQDRDQKARRMKSQCGVFPKYDIASLDALDLPTERLNVSDLMKYVAKRDTLKDLLSIPETVILCGANGPGKTYLASALVNEFCNQGRSAFYCRAVDFFVMVKSTFGAPGKTLEDLERKFRNYELLVVDEIEVRSGSVWEDNVLRSLVDARYASLRSTVIITNKNPEQIVEYFSAAILSRVTEAGSIAICDWPSLRERQVVQ